MLRKVKCAGCNGNGKVRSKEYEQMDSCMDCGGNGFLVLDDLIILKNCLANAGIKAGEVVALIEKVEKLPPVEPASVAMMRQVSEALDVYHDALNNRQHGGVAAGNFVTVVETLLDRPWKQAPPTQTTG